MLEFWTEFGKHKAVQRLRVRTGFLILVFVANVSVVTAQETWGTIIFRNVGIVTRNGYGTYNVPIWSDPTFTPNKTGVGMLPGGATAGLFRLQDSAPLATSSFGTTTQLSPYWANPISQTVPIPGVCSLGQRQR
jgi:hypothetical protein